MKTKAIVLFAAIIGVSAVRYYSYTKRYCPNWQEIER